MTPTEQDNELEAAICKVMNIFPEELEYNLPNFFGKSELEAIMQLITADRKRVALEARIDELEDLSPGMHYFGDIVKIDNRIAELKAQQEEL